MISRPNQLLQLIQRAQQIDRAGSHPPSSGFKRIVEPAQIRGCAAKQKRRYDKVAPYLCMIDNRLIAESELDVRQCSDNEIPGLLHGSNIHSLIR